MLLDKVYQPQTELQGSLNEPKDVDADFSLSW